MEPMKTMHKRWIFWSLFLSFFAYSYVVYTSGTSFPKGHSLYTEQAREGKDVFQKYNCISCHQILGLGGYMGPDLTNVVSETNKGENYARAFILSGTNKMPNFNMEKEEIDALIAYLKYIGNSVDYPLNNSSSTWYGMLENTTNE